MIVEYNNSYYRIVFQKEPHTIRIKRKQITLIDTWCVIRAVKGFSFINGHDLGRGKAKQYVKDRYNKIIGKKYALQKAIDSAALVSERDAFKDKALRTAIWKKFFETFGRWR